MNLTTTTAYETPGPGTYLRRTSKTLPSGAASTINDVYYANTEMRTNPCPSGGSANQGGRLKMSTDADPDGAGAQLPVQHETIYDTLGRPVATRTGTNGTGSWVCTTYDTRSRPTTVAYPAYGAGTARTVTYNYAVGGNPFVSSVTDPAGTITTTIDLLGRVTNYTDVWGKTTTTSYDLAGRATSSTTTGTAALTRTYDNAGRLETLSTGGLLLADPHYDTYGRLDSVAYPSGTGKAGNGTTGVFTYDTNGRPSGVTWTGPGGTITSDAVTARDILGRITDQTTDGVDPYPAGVNDVYDKAGRLTTARTTGHTYTYNFAATNTCGTATAAGKNTNRTSMVDNAATTSYCYDNADRLTSTTDPAVGTLAYDSHGNTTTISGETHSYDSADRHLTTTKGATNVTYTRDATDRIVQRATGSFIVRYSNPGGGDTPSLTLDGTSNIVEQTLALPGGAMYTTRTGGNVWSYPNTHSDYVAVANQTGTKQGATTTYDPYGNTTTGAVPDNSAGQMDYGWLGQPQRPTEQQTSLQPTIEMGARQYNPRLGRFIEQDPIEGGSANDYDYTNADPINQFDFAGTWPSCSWCRKAYNGAKGKAKSVGRRVLHVGRAYANLPFTAVGVTYATMAGGRCRLAKGLMVTCTGTKLVPRAGFTIGNTFVTKEQNVSAALLRHESIHASQWMLFGANFPAAYTSAEVIGGRGACTNVFERAAGLRDGGYGYCYDRYFANHYIRCGGCDSNLPCGVRALCAVHCLW